MGYTETSVCSWFTNKQPILISLSLFRNELKDPGVSMGLEGLGPS